MIVALAVALGCFYFFDLGQFITLGFVQSQIMALQEFRETNFPLAAVLYFSAYVAITHSQFRGSYYYPPWRSHVWPVLGDAAGLICQYHRCHGGVFDRRVLLRDWVQSCFGESLKPINEGIAKDGGFYLFSLRMIPLFPFFW